MKWNLLLLAGMVALPAVALPAPLPVFAQAPPAEASKADFSSPEGTLRTFVAAISRADVLGAAACVDGTIQPEKLKEWIDDWKKPESKPPSLGLSDVKVTPSGETATAEYTLLVTAPGGPAPADFKETVKFRKVGAKWLIVPLAPEALAEVNKHPETPQVVSMLATMMSNPDIFLRARAAARKAVCRSNLKQLATGVFLVATDHDDRIALRADQMRAGLLKYVKNTVVFQCPEHSQEPVGYSFNANLQGVLLGKIKQPGRTVMLYEGKRGALDFRHDGTACVAFADGRTAFVDAAAAKRLLWKP